MKTKRCTQCDRVLPVAEFHRRQHYVKSGARAACKECTREAAKDAPKKEPAEVDRNGLSAEENGFTDVIFLDETYRCDADTYSAVRGSSHSEKVHVRSCGTIDRRSSPNPTH